MRAAARRNGVRLVVVSAFRGVEKQNRIIRAKKLRGMSLSEIYKVSAPAGFSEHHTGFAVDFYPTEPEFERTAAFDWLK